MARIAGVNIPTNKRFVIALTYIYGIGRSRAEMICKELGISVNKCTKVVKGGKNLSFAVLVVVGDKKGRINFGIGKAREVADARAKAFTNAKKSLKKVPLKEGRTLHHDYEGDFGACKVIIRNAPSGTGVISGGIMRSIFECLGVKDVVAMVCLLEPEF